MAHPGEYMLLPACNGWAFRYEVHQVARADMHSFYYDNNNLKSKMNMTTKVLEHFVFASDASSAYSVFGATLWLEKTVDARASDSDLFLLTYFYNCYGIELEDPRVERFQIATPPTADQSCPGIQLGFSFTKNGSPTTHDPSVAVPIGAVRYSADEWLVQLAIDTFITDCNAASPGLDLASLVDVMVSEQDVTLSNPYAACEESYPDGLSCADYSVYDQCTIMGDAATCSSVGSDMALYEIVHCATESGCYYFSNYGAPTFYNFFDRYDKSSASVAFEPERIFAF